MTEFYLVNQWNCSTHVFVSSIPTFFDLERNISAIWASRTAEYTFFFWEDDRPVTGRRWYVKYPTERSRNNNNKEWRLQLALMWNNWTVKFRISFVGQKTTATRKKWKTGVWDSCVKYSRVVNTCVKVPLKTPKNYR